MSEPLSSQSVVICENCGHTEDRDTAIERWAMHIQTGEWLCDECWQEEDFEDAT